MSGEYLAQSKHQISANRLHKKQPDVPVFLVTSGCFI